VEWKWMMLQEGKRLSEDEMTRGRNDRGGNDQGMK
jgi:hypothetical protein